ncbi:YraN family protein [Roseovarius aestuariivivens]|uniref:YraN family protein n=1 Tax=Roseovarius aestuariivivens TaxID=1888910 RepID=UPI00108198B0|nr:YraN family protein [Roseovarius aestuariivivens]
MLDLIDTGAVAERRRERGQRACLSGAAAERSVIAHYAQHGAGLRDQRWRGGGGEIDLVLDTGDEVVFCEVKRGATHAAAAERLRPAQIRRIIAAASAYMDSLPAGQLSAVRFDLATVDARGHVEVLEAAFGHF